MKQPSSIFIATLEQEENEEEEEEEEKEEEEKEQEERRGAKGQGVEWIWQGNQSY